MISLLYPLLLVVVTMGLAMMFSKEGRPLGWKMSLAGVVIFILWITDFGATKDIAEIMSIIVRSLIIWFPYYIWVVPLQIGIMMLKKWPRMRAISIAIISLSSLYFFILMMWSIIELYF
jgi:hypothetical protein